MARTLIFGLYEVPPTAHCKFSFSLYICKNKFQRDLCICTYINFMLFSSCIFNWWSQVLKWNTFFRSMRLAYISDNRKYTHHFKNLLSTTMCIKNYRPCLFIDYNNEYLYSCMFKNKNLALFPTMGSWIKNKLVPVIWTFVRFANNLLE